MHRDQLHVGLERRAELFARRLVPGVRELAHRRVEDVEERAIRVGDRVSKQVAWFILDERRETCARASGLGALTQIPKKLNGIIHIPENSHKITN